MCTLFDSEMVVKDGQGVEDIALVEFMLPSVREELREPFVF